MPWNVDAAVRRPDAVEAAELAGTRTERRCPVLAQCPQMPAATAAAEPDEEPPGTRPGARTFTGVP